MLLVAMRASGVAAACTGRPCCRRCRPVGATRDIITVRDNRGKQPDGWFFESVKSSDKSIAGVAISRRRHMNFQTNISSGWRERGYDDSSQGLFFTSQDR